MVAIAAKSVVLLPLPVGPVTRIIPYGVVITFLDRARSSS
jgi:hypothetical protein